MTNPDSTYFEPETIELLKSTLEEAWASLPSSRQRTVLKTELAERILAAAASGERDPDRLRARALMRPVHPAQSSGHRAIAILQSVLARHA